MSQSPPVTPPPAAGAVTYRPLSGLAIASLALSGLYAILVLATGIASLVRSAPPLLPFWLLLVPVAGIVLAVVARWRIGASEGTQAGEGLARWGLWLGVVAGLGYGAYYFATGLAVEKQANDFLMNAGEDSGFFPRLLQGDVNGAFLLTQPAGRRVGLNPDDQMRMDWEFDRPGGQENRGHLSLFRESDIIQALLQAGRENRPVEPLGVREWDYESHTYRVARDYRIRTREYDALDIVVPTVAETDSAGKGRKWYLDWPRTAKLPTTKLTPLGETMQKVRMHAANFLGSWSQALQAGKVHGPVPRDLTTWEGASRQAVRVVKHDARSVDEIKELAKRGIQALLSGRGPSGVTVTLPPQPQCPWDQVDGRLQLTLAFQAPVVTDVHGQAAYLGDGRLIVQSKAPFDPLNVTGAPAWEVVGFRLERITPSKTAMMKSQARKRAAAGG